MYKRNLYEINITKKGYVRTNNGLSGNIEFFYKQKVEANSFEEASAVAKYILNDSLAIEDNFINASFFMDFQNDEIIRDDTEIIISEPERLFYSYRNFINDFNKKLSFLLLINNKDKKEIRKNLYIQKKFIISKSDIWTFLDNKYFLPNKIRFNVPILNLNKIRPETYFKQNIKILPEFSYYNNLINSSKELIDFLNSIINNYNINLEKKEVINSISNNKKKKLEKSNNKKREILFENILKESKLNFIKEINEKIKENNLEEYIDKFYISIIKK